jgi:IclR family acetate operon transcriptional repressor
MPALRRLSQDTGETALLTVLTPGRDRGVCLERVETPQPLRLSVTPGRQLPLHECASQKVLLAYLSDDETERVIGAGLEHLCHATITDPQLLREELATIRRRGWASSYEETNLGVWGVAVPVVTPRDEIVCAVGIAGPSARLTPARVRNDVERAHAAAREIARALGLHVPELSATRSAITPRKGYTKDRTKEKRGA